MDTRKKARRMPPDGKAPQDKSPARKKAGATEKSKAPQKPLQDVVYLPPKPFHRNRFLLRLATVAAVVLAMVLAMSVFFKVEHFEVSGMDQYTAWDISQASGIKTGDSLFSLGIPNAAARIQALPYIKNVRIGIKLPNTVTIVVTEVPATYAMKAQDDSWWLVTSDGRIVEKASQEIPETQTKILGVQLLNPQAGQQAAAYETARPEQDENGTTIPVTVTATQRLSTALDIAAFLEANGVIGQAASIDVSDIGNLELWYGKQYQVKLGDTSQLAYKISSMKSAIDELSKDSHNSGVLDVTFTVDKNGVRYTRFQ